MKTFAFLCTALAIVCLPDAASAHDAAQSKRHTACLKKSGDTTAGMIECIDTEFLRQDARLNKAYQALMANLADPRREKLQQAQRIWLKYRDANCDFYADPDGGTIAQVSANNCMLNTTAERARELESLRQ
jgi:uncharacterized protein YecT (DUF1311 family)